MATAIPTFSAPYIALSPPVLYPSVDRRSFSVPLMSLRGRNAVITGATRGIGRGLALGCAELGANLYITGRTESQLQTVADEVRKLGGTCQYFVVDHSNDKDIELLFTNLQNTLSANGATLDLFVNNAYAAASFLVDSMNVPFWLKDVENPKTPNNTADPGKVWDAVNGVGLRNNFICSSRAMRIMAPQGQGLIINITSWAGMISLFDPAYSIGKAAVERLSAELAVSARNTGVKSFAFCPGFVSTEIVKNAAQHAVDPQTKDENYQVAGNTPMWNAETPLFVGRVLAALVSEKGEKYWGSMNGQVVIACEVADYLDVSDENDFRPMSPRGLRYQALSVMPFLRESPLRNLIPRSLNAPWFLVRAIKGVHRFWN